MKRALNVDSWITQRNWDLNRKQSYLRPQDSLCCLRPPQQESTFPFQECWWRELRVHEVAIISTRGVERVDFSSWRGRPALWTGECEEDAWSSVITKETCNFSKFLPDQYRFNEWESKAFFQVLFYPSSQLLKLLKRHDTVASHGSTKLSLS